jgi:hypothetical protein
METDPDLNVLDCYTEWREDGGADVRCWQAEQLERLGIPLLQAALFADTVDWHEVERIIAHGCAPGLALEIAR